MRLIALAFVLATSTVGVGCASRGGAGLRSEAVLLQVPAWFLTPGRFTEMPHGVGTAYSRDMGIARSQAIALARVDLVRQIETRLEGLIETNQGQLGSVSPRAHQFFNQAAREVLQARLVGVQTHQAEVVREAIGYRFYVMVVQDVAAANKAILEQMSTDEALYAEFQKTEAFERLNAEIRRLEGNPPGSGDDS